MSNEQDFTEKPSEKLFINNKVNKIKSNEDHINFCLRKKNDMKQSMKLLKVYIKRSRNTVVNSQ